MPRAGTFRSQAVGLRIAASTLSSNSLKTLDSMPTDFGPTVSHVVLPLSLAAFSRHYGWSAGPGAWNLPGIIVILFGLGLFTAALREHIRKFKNLQKVNLTTPEHLIQTGPYRFTRNPLYLGAALVWLGWTIFLGSLWVLGGLVVLVVGTSLIVIPWEERKLELSFGSAYLTYKRTVPRWLGRRRHLG